MFSKHQVKDHKESHQEVLPDLDLKDNKETVHLNSKDNKETAHLNSKEETVHKETNLLEINHNLKEETNLL